MAEEDRALVQAEGRAEALEQSILLAIDGEDHTFGNMLRDVMWQHPHVQLASYTKKHPTSTEVLVRCQTSDKVSAEQGVVEALHIGKSMLSVVEEEMSAAVETWWQQHERSVQQQPMDEG